MDTFLQALQTIALLCQTQFAAASLRSECINEYIECSCSKLKSGDLSCSTNDMSEKLVSCVFNNTETKNKAK
jgi:hypothetical protein